MAVFKRTYIDPKSGERRKTKKFYGSYTDANGISRRVPLAADKTVSESMLLELKKQAEREAAGLVDPTEKHRKRPLSELLEEYRQSQTSKRVSPKQVGQVVSRVSKIFAGCGFRRLADLNGERVLNWLADQRERGVFGIQTANHYLAAVKSVGNWLVKTRRLPANPFAYLSKLNDAVEEKRERRSLSPEDLAKLISTTAKSGGVFRGLDGMARAMLYRLASSSGLRVSELASLTHKSFHLTDDPPTVTIQAKSAKNRKSAILPLPRSLADALKTWMASRAEETPQRKTIPLEGKALQEPVWPGTWSERAARMLRSDLEAAGIPFEDESGRVFDFHSLRGQFITDLGRGGVSLQEAQKLARHSDPRLTANHYTHLSIQDLSGAVERLPIGSPVCTQTATGTDSGRGETAISTGLKLLRESEKPARNCPERLTPVVPELSTIDHSDREHSTKEKPRDSRGDEGDCPELSTIGAGVNGNAPCWIRTSDLRFRKLHPDIPNPLADQELHETENPTGPPTGLFSVCSGQSETPIDPDLQWVINAWGSLPASIRTAIVAMIHSLRLET